MHEHRIMIDRVFPQSLVGKFLQDYYVVDKQPSFWRVLGGFSDNSQKNQNLLGNFG